MTSRSVLAFGRRILLPALFGALTTCTEAPTPTSPGRSPEVGTAQAVTGITQTVLTSGTNAVNQKIYTTASIAPAANALITVAVLGHNSSAAPASPTVSGAGMTWTVVASVTLDGVATPHKRLTVYRAMSAAPGSGPLTITFASSVSNCQWIVSQWTGVDGSGVNGAGAINQTGVSQGDGVTSQTVVLGAFGNANNAAYGVFGVAKSTPAVTPGAGFTEIAEQASAESPLSDLEAEWATNQPALTASWASANAGALGIEIVAGQSSPPTTSTLSLTMAGSGTVALSPGSQSGGTCANPATASCSAVYLITDNVTLTAIAASGWSFSGWSGDCTGTGTCSLAMSTSHAATATFAQVTLPTHALSLALGGSGQVTLSPGSQPGGTCVSPTATSCTGVFLATDTVTLTPGGGTFLGWGGDCSGTGICKLPMSADRAATATFAPPSSGGGSIVQTLLTSGTNPANQKVYTTASIAPAPNALVTVAVLGHNSTAAPASPTVSGGGMTWTVVASVTFDGVATPHKRLTVYRALSAAPGSGSLTITFSSSVSNCQWLVSQWSGVDGSGVNGSGAIAQTGSSQGDASSGLTVGLAAFGNPNDVAYGVFGVAKNALAVTPGAGFTEIAEQASGESPAADLESEWATNRPAIASAWASANAAALGLEIRAGSSGPSILDLSIDRMYVTQAVQTLTNTVSLVSSRAGLLRVFVRASQSAVDVPSVRVSVYNGSTLIATNTIAGARPAPVAIDESDLSSSWNYSLPGSLVQPGYSIVAEVDPGHAITESNEGNNTLTYSETVRSTAAQAFRFVPVKQTGNGLTGDVTTANAATYVDMPVRIYPILTPGLDVHQTYTTNTPVDNGSDAAWSQILSEIDALRVAEGTSQSYVGVVRVTYNSGIVGIAYIGRPTSVVWDDSTTRSLFWAHELGHTYGRQHAPGCNPDFPDPNYPYPDATIGVYGTDATVTPPILYPPSFHDIMSYCDDAWISDYTYKGVLNFVATSQPTQASAVLPLQRSMLIWGRIRDGEPYLEPAFVLDAHPVQPSTAGTYQVQGVDKDGVVLFSQAFDPTTVADQRGGNDSHFAFAVPMSDVVQSRLVALRVIGRGRQFVRTATTPITQGVAPAAPQGLVPSWQGQEAAISWDTLAVPLVMVRDAATGQILSIARRGRVVVSSRTDFDLILSNGVNSTVQRVRAP
jgi:hypothetical protein